MSPEDYTHYQQRRRMTARHATTARMAANTPTRTWRFAKQFSLYGDTHVAAMRGTYINAGRAFALAFATYKADETLENAEAVAALLVEYSLPPSTRDRIATTFNDFCLCDHELQPCADCGTWFAGDDGGMTEVEDFGHVCDSCMENDERYKEAADGLYYNTDTTRLYPVFASVGDADDDRPSGWTPRVYGRQNLYPIEHDNYSYAYMDDSYTQSCWEERYNNKDDDEYGVALSDYHDARQRNDGGYFDEQNATPAVPALGIEVEVYTNEVSFALWNLREDANPLIRDMIYERDGSLHNGRSFEVVTPPLGRSEWATFGPELCAVLTSAGIVGYNTPNDGTQYGIHINMHRRHLSQLAEARIMMFLCAEQNKRFVQAVAQRPSVYNPVVDIGQLLPGAKLYQVGARRGYSSVRTNDHHGKIHGVGKYAPLQLKIDPDIAEFRLFQSTLNPISFMKNIEFVYALWAWTLPSSGTGNSWAHTDFLTWLTAPQHRKDYPNLVAYLSRKTFKLKGGYTIQNEWLAHITKPVDEVFVELLAA